MYLSSFLKKHQFSTWMFVLFDLIPNMRHLNLISKRILFSKKHKEKCYKLKQKSVN